MKFFIPLAVDQQQAVRIYSRIIKRLEGLACEVIASRIYKVLYRMDSRVVSGTVGAAAKTVKLFWLFSATMWAIPSLRTAGARFGVSQLLPAIP